MYVGKEANIDAVVADKTYSDLELAWLEEVLTPYMNYLQWLFGEARGRP